MLAGGRGSADAHFDRPAAELAGRIAADLEHVGRPIGLADPMIAAGMIAEGC
jgi:tRNA(fMet)-specific endonuclease VapC